MECSFVTRWLDNSLLNCLSAAFSLWCLLLLMGCSEFLCNFLIPKYPESVLILIFDTNRTFDFLNSAKSWVLPLQTATAIILRVALSTIICAFMVWRFFLPEYHFRCPFFWVAQQVFLLRQPKQPQTQLHLSETLFYQGWKMFRLLSIHLLST